MLYVQFGQLIQTTYLQMFECNGDITILSIVTPKSASTSIITFLEEDQIGPDTPYKRGPDRALDSHYEDICGVFLWWLHSVIRLHQKC